MAMDIPDSEWSFDSIRAVEPLRADRLEKAAHSNQLIDALVSACELAVDDQTLRFATDRKKGASIEYRSIIQFPLSPEVFDWFYNARTGYRAQFWRGWETGIEFNQRLIAAIRKSLDTRLGHTIFARKIELLSGEGRQEQDVGETALTKQQFLHSFDPVVSKAWMCELLYSSSGEQPKPIGNVELVAAARGPKLQVPRWDRPNPDYEGAHDEGLRAPMPTKENSWLDIKGGFVGTDGRLSQPKPPERRARQLEQFGWTWQPPTEAT